MKTKKTLQMPSEAAKRFRFCRKCNAGATQAERRDLERLYAGMSDDQIRYQVAAHERQNDFGETFDIAVNEYRKRGLTATGDWQDQGEVRAGA